MLCALFITRSIMTKLQTKVNTLVLESISLLELFESVIDLLISLMQLI